MSLLHSLPSIVSNSGKRVGRGFGSGKGGHTPGRGHKGHRARTGKPVPLWFEGGQLPLIKRLPMWRGKGRFEVLEPTAEVSLTELQNMKAEVITLDTLKLENVIDARFKKAKIIGNGTLERKVVIEGIKASASAQKAIVKAGGTLK